MTGVFNKIKKIPAVLWVIVVLAIVFSFFSKRYLTLRNLVVLLQQGSVLLVVASAATFVIISGGLDLSLGGILTLSGVIVALSVNAGVPAIPAIFIGGVAGAICGALNGVLISYCGMQPFITTLGTQGIMYGIALALTNKEGIHVSNEAFIFFGDMIGYLPMAAISCLVIWLFAIFIQNHTRLGRYTFAIGGNKMGSSLSGVDTHFWQWMIYVFAGFLTGLGAAILVARLEVADPIVGKQWEFEAIAASIIGGTSMKIGKGDVRGTIFGVALFTIIRSGMNVVRVNSMWQPAILGSIIVFSIVLQVTLVDRRNTK